LPGTSATRTTRCSPTPTQITYPPNPIRNLDNSLTPDQQAGRNFYFDSNPSDQIGTCNFCHVIDPAQGFFGGDGFSVIEPQAFKIPHLRNAYQKVGMFGMPLIPGLLGFNPGNNDPLGDQVRGFGFLHDGSIDTLFRFMNLTGFNQGPGNSGGFPSGSAGQTLRRQVEAFMLAFDSSLAPIVGQQTTLTGINAGVAGPRIDLLVARAAAGECDVVVKGLLDGAARGWVRTASGLFQPDRAAEPLLTDAALRAQAGVAGQERTYTCVPRGSGERIGVDRDGDGFYDRDELDAGSNPADPGSVPLLCAGGPPIERARFKIARNQLPAGDEKLLAKGELQLGTMPIDPAGSGVTLAVSSGSGVLLYTRTVPGGGAGWRVNGKGTKWIYSDQSGALAGGITKVVISDRSSSVPGLHRVLVRGNDGNFHIGASAVPVRMLLVLGSAPDQCATRAFNPDGGGAPACRLSATGNVLNCK
jgi:hypothetical protein